MGLLAERIVVITGAGSGIGRASARLFASEGANVICADVRRSWVDDTVAMVADEGGTAVALTCDVTNEVDVQRAVQAAVEHFGRLDVMFNNAGIASPRPGTLLEDHTAEEFNLLLAVNASGVFYGCKAAVRQFKLQGGGGVIVNTGSIAGMISWGGVAYGATKGLVIQLTRALAVEVAPAHIRVNCVCPGGVRTNFAQPEDRAFVAPGDEELAYLRGLHPLGEIIAPEDIARTALYLASDLSMNVTGIALPVDGGYIAK